MKNETARREIESLDYYLQNHTDDYSEESHTAMMMAVKALDQEPCGDSISRQAVDELSKALVHTTRDKADFLCNFWEGLQKLPPVTPQEPKTGQWIGIDEEPHEDYECDKCGYVVSTFTANIKPHTEYKYCPNCGAKMESEG